MKVSMNKISTLKLIAVLVYLGFAFILVGCQGEEEMIRFETIEKELHFETFELKNNVGGQLWEFYNPWMVIISQPVYAYPLRDYVSEDTFEGLINLDYTRYISLCAFRGHQCCTFTGFSIERVIRTNNVVSIVTNPGESPSPSGQTTTSPYHCIWVHKDGEWGQTTLFKMFFENQAVEVSAVRHFIP
jgi:hypothetical protein